MDKLFWQQMTNARRYIDDAVSTLTASENCKSVSLVIPKDIPWYTTMKSLIESGVKQHNAMKSMDIIDCPEEAPGKYLLDSYCKREKRATYRPVKSYAQFLAEAEDIVLNDKYIWVRNIPNTGKYHEWESFITEYNQKMKKENTPAVFILEYIGEESFQDRKALSVLCYRDYINPFDYYTLATMIASGVSVEDKLKPYLSELASCLCGDNLSACAACVAGGERFLTDPISFMEENGIAYTLAADEKSLKKQIWEVQIKILFPRIENYRSSFIEKYKSQIENVLPINGPFGAMIESVEEVEIGPLSYMAGSRLIDVPAREGIKLSEIKTARDMLAHIKPLAYEDVRKILL